MGEKLALRQATEGGSVARTGSFGGSRRSEPLQAHTVSKTPGLVSTLSYFAQLTTGLTLLFLNVRLAVDFDSLTRCCWKGPRQHPTRQEAEPTAHLDGRLPRDSQLTLH